MAPSQGKAPKPGSMARTKIAKPSVTLLNGRRASVPEEMDYKQAYLEIVSVVAPRFPECSIYTVDLVRLLAFENDTLRMALNLPLATKVVAAIEDDLN
jgi:hypothetical protein